MKIQFEEKPQQEQIYQDKRKKKAPLYRQY